MEELLMFLAEILLECLVQMPLDSLLSRKERRAREQDRALRFSLSIAGALIFGAGLGWLSALIWPSFWPASTMGRVLMLAGSPLLVGYVSWLINTAKERRGRDWLRPWRHAVCAGLFALAWAITRTLLASSAA